MTSDDPAIGLQPPNNNSNFAASAPSPEVTPAAGGVRKRLLPFAGLAVGIAIGVSAWLTTAGDKEVEPKQVLTVKRALSAEEIIARADECIEARDFRTAFRLCNNLENVGNDQVRYRLALAREGIGEVDAAISLFTELAVREKASRMTLAARFGLARCLVMAGRWDEAEALLARLDLVRTHPAWCGQPIAAEIACWRAGLRMTNLESQRPSAAFTPEAVASINLRSPVERYLVWASVDDKDEPETLATSLTIETRFADGFRPRVHWRSASGPALERIRDLSARLQLSLTISAGAAAHLEGQEIELAIDSMMASDLLTDLADVSGLAYAIQGNELTIRERGERIVLESERGRRIRTDLRAAACVDIEHPFREAAALELANFSAYSGRLGNAAREYRDIVGEFPDSEAARLAEFNLGLVRLRAGDPDRAREMLLNAIDRSPKDELAGRAWWFIARSYLDYGDWEGSMRSLRMAAANPSVEVRAVAALGLCAARLYAGANEEGHSALGHGPRMLMKKAPFQLEAAFLDAYSRFRIARCAHPRPMVETEDLLTALSASPGEPILGPTGVLLHGQALNDLGMDERMAEYFENSLSKLSGPLVSRMAAMLAEHYMRTGNTAAAGRALLTYGQPSEADPRTQLLFAEVALRQARPDECLAICRGSLTDPAVNRAAALRLMGRAFELLGDPRHAAECYAGRVPQQ